jgi:hypothetical protein
MFFATMSALCDIPESSFMYQAISHKVHIPIAKKKGT